MKHAFWLSSQVLNQVRQIALLSICSTEQTADLGRDDGGGAGKG